LENETDKVRMTETEEEEEIKKEKKRV